MSTTGLLITNVRTGGAAAAVDVLLEGDRIAGIGPDLTPPPDVPIEDGRGRLLLAAPIDAHCHVDKTLWGAPWVPHSAGPALADRIANGEGRRAELGLPSFDNITALLAQMVCHGTTAIRTHTDVDPDLGLRGIEVVAAAADQLKDCIDVEQVAFPQGGLLTRPGTAELLEQALKNGVTVLGGIDPAAVDRNPVGQLDLLFRLAANHGAAIDIHLHERGTLGAFEMELVTDYTQRFGLQGRVALSHAVAIADVDTAYGDRLATGLAAAGVALVTATVYNTPVLPIARLRQLGVTVASGNDGICDLWGPYGSGDMFERAYHLAYRSGARRDDEIEGALATAVSGGAAVLGRPVPELSVGSSADLVLVEASGAAEAVVRRPSGRLVVKRGRIVARDGALTAPE